MAVIIVVRCCHCRRFIVSCDRHRVLVCDAWALQPGGGWLRGVALAPLDCGGGCALWWTLVVAAHAVGHWELALHACVQCQGLWAWWMVDVEGAGGALQLLLQLRTIEVVSGWWRASIGNRAIGIARLCAMPGPFDHVDREGEGV